MGFEVSQQRFRTARLSPVRFVKIAFLDLKLVYFAEDYSLFPKRYGGLRIFAAHLKEFDNFYIFADPECFNNLQPSERRDRCIATNADQRYLLASGAPVSQVLPELGSFDLVVHPHTHVHLNTSGTKLKQLVWQLGIEEEVHPNHDRLLLYNDFQRIQLRNIHTKIYKFTLGTKIPEFFKEYPKEDFIFQCSRHVPVFNSIEIASFCNRNGIKAYFAGPVPDEYPFCEVIDNKNSFYLGEISEEEKIDYTRRARLYTLLQNWPTPFSLSAVEALSVGTPVVATTWGFWPTLIKHGVNGFFASNEAELLNAWNQSQFINQAECYKSVLKYNHLAMIDSLYNVFGKICVD